MPKICAHCQSSEAKKAQRLRGLNFLRLQMFLNEPGHNPLTFEVKESSFTETSVSTCKATRYHNPQIHHFNKSCRES
jgi:hypothetical protein